MTCLILIILIKNTELQLNKSNSFDTEAPFLDFNLSLTNNTIISKLYDKRGEFEIVNLLFLDGDVRPSPSYGVCSSFVLQE